MARSPLAALPGRCLALGSAGAKVCPPAFMAFKAERFRWCCLISASPLSRQRSSAAQKRGRALEKLGPAGPPGAIPAGSTPVLNPEPCLPVSGDAVESLVLVCPLCNLRFTK